MENNRLDRPSRSIRSKQSRSCDECRRRKCKCDREYRDIQLDPYREALACTSCQKAGTECTFGFKQRKRGRACRNAAGQPGAILSGTMVVSASESVSQSDPDTTLHSILSFSANGPYPADEDGIEIIDGISGQMDPPTSLSGDATCNTGENRQLDALEHCSLASAPSAQGLPDDPLVPDAGQDQSGQSRHESESVGPLEGVFPRALLLDIIGLYIDCVYSLLPCIYRPSLLADIKAHRDVRPGEGEWTTMVFAVVGVTLCLIPRHWLDLSALRVLEYVRTCEAITRSYLNDLSHHVSTRRLVILHLSTFLTSSLGYGTTAKGQRATLYGLSVAMGLHREETYLNLNPIECEIRRRLFWLQYASDKGGAAIYDHPVNWHEEDCAGIALPRIIDDEYFNEDAYSQQPGGHTSIIWGFYYISKLFRYLGQVLQHRKQDMINPPSGAALQIRIIEARFLYSCVVSLMCDCPDELKPDMTAANDAVNSSRAVGTVTTDATDERTLRDILQSHARRPSDLRTFAFQVQQANIYVTQQMARNTILLYQQRLLLIQEREIVTKMSSHLYRWSPSAMPIDPMQADLEQITKDLLTILQAIPVQAAAICGLALTVKVRYIACRLLNSTSYVPDSRERTEREDDEKRSQAQAYLSRYLRIMEVIEELVKLDVEERSGFE